MKITINLDLDEIKLNAGKADKLLIDHSLDKELAKIMLIQKELEEALDKASSLIAEAGLKINPNFKSIEGDTIKASFRAYGQKYYIEENKLAEVPKELYVKEIITKYKVNSEAVDTFVEEKGGLPTGIYAPERTKKLSISLKKNAKD